MVAEPDGELPILYIDLHLVHEVTSPQAFEGLRNAERKMRRPDLTIATVDHDVPTDSLRAERIEDNLARKQIETLRSNTRDFGVKMYDISSREQGIVHVIGPEQGYTQPGKTIVCGDSHTATHGAFGALAFGIGTSEVEHVLATQTLRQRRPQTCEVRFEGDLAAGVTAKDMILHLIRKTGVAGGTGYVYEYTGKAVRDLGMAGRMTICNMSIEGGARAGMIAPDDTTFGWLEGKPNAPRGAHWERAVEYWQSLPTDDGTDYDARVKIDCSEIEPSVSWGTNPGQVIGISEKIPDPDSHDDLSKKEAATVALRYMDLEPGTALTDVKLDRIFIGSCTNARIEDLRVAAEVVKGKKIAPSVRAMVVPGSTLTKFLAEKEGLDTVFKKAGFEWREAGCSMCLGMNPDILMPGERCASTSNRNFEGRQGKGGRTHLASPQMVAAAALSGHFVDIREQL